MNTLTPEEQRQLRGLIRVMERLKDSDERMTVSSMLALLYAAVEPPPVVQATLERNLGLSGATASRSVAYWKKFRLRDKPGKDMLDTYPDPDNQTFRRVELKPRGLAFLRHIIEDLRWASGGNIGDNDNGPTTGS